MMARLPFAAAPLALVRIQTLWAGHSVVKVFEGPDRRVACEQLVIPLGRGLARYTPNYHPSLGPPDFDTGRRARRTTGS